MKVKGISFFEQHVEKFVLLGAAVLALFFAAMQFLGPGNTIEMAGGNLAASEVDEALANKAEDVRAQLNDTAPPTVTPPEAPDVAGWFTANLNRSVGPPDRALVSVPLAPMAISEVDLVQLDKPFYVPTFAAASQPFVAQHADALTADTMDLLPDEYEDDLVFSTSGTTDVSFVTPAFMLDLDAIRTAYAAEDPSGDTLQIPSSWYDNRIYILWVTFERQVRQPDGTWSEAQEVRPRPEFQSHRDYVNNDPVFTVQGMEDVKAWLREAPGLNQASIIQPEFFPTKSMTWSPPEPPREEESDPVMEEVLDLQAQIESFDSRLARVMDELNELGGPITDEERSRGGSSGGGRRNTRTARRRPRGAAADRAIPGRWGRGRHRSRRRRHRLRQHPRRGAKSAPNWAAVANSRAR